MNILLCGSWDGAERDAWAGRRLFDHHPFMGFGVKTDDQLRVLRGGKPRRTAKY